MSSMIKRLAGSLTKVQENVFIQIQELTGLKRAELYRRALDYYIISHADRLEAVNITLPNEIKSKDISTVEIPLPSPVTNKDKEGH